MGELGHQGLVGLGKGPEEGGADAGEVVEEVHRKHQGGKELEHPPHQARKETQEVPPLVQKGLKPAKKGLEKALEKPFQVPPRLFQDGVQEGGDGDGPDPVRKVRKPGHQGGQALGELQAQAGKLQHRLGGEEGGQAQEEAQAQVDQDHP